MGHDVLIRNNVKVFGAGTQPMLFAHAFNCDQTVWRYITPSFYDSHRIVLLDHIGAGRSDAGAFDPIRHLSLNGYAQDVLEVCEALDLRDVIFVGHSAGGTIGMLAANEAPERFAKLVLMNSAPRYLNDPPSYITGVDEELVERWLNEANENYLGWGSILAGEMEDMESRPEVAKELAEMFWANDPQSARRLLETVLYADNRDDMRRLSVPALLLHTTGDPIVPREIAEHMHREMPGTTLRFLDGAWHFPHLSHPEETIAAIKQYLES